MKSIAGKIALVLGGVVVVELLLHLLAAAVPLVGERLSGLKPAYIVDERLGVRGDPALADYDSAGFRNASRPDTATVVAIGDSQTAGSGVSRENAWPQLLAVETGLDVYQFAFGSYGPGQYVTLIDDALTLSPGVIVVAVYFGNDLPDVYQWTYEHGKSPPVASEDADILQAIAAADSERPGLEETWAQTRNARKGLEDAPVRRWLRENVQERSKLYALYEQIAFRLEHSGGTLSSGRKSRSVEEIRATVEASTPALLYGFDDGDISTVFTPGARFAALDTSDPRIAEGLRLTKSALELANERVGDEAAFLVALVPTKETAYAAAVARAEGGLAPPLAEVVTAETRVRESLLAFLGERGIAAVDLGPALSEAVLSGTVAYPNDWDGHPNATGDGVIARAVANSAAVRQLKQ